MSVDMHFGNAVHGVIPYIKYYRPQYPIDHGDIRKYLDSRKFLREVNGGFSPKEFRPAHWKRIYFAWNYVAELLTLADDYRFELQINGGSINTDIILMHGRFIYVIEIKTSKRPNLLLKAKKQLEKTVQHLRSNNTKGLFTIVGYCLIMPKDIDQKTPIDAEWLQLVAA